MIKLAKDEDHFGGQKALLLFETPQDVLKAVQGGVPLSTVNVGSMAHSTGKVQPNKVLAFDQNDIDTFKELKDSGISFDVRKVPNDSKGNMEEILKKHKKKLISTNFYYKRNGGIITMDLNFIQIILVIIVAFLAGVEGILDQFHFHQPVIACTLIGLVTGNLIPLSYFRWYTTNDRSWLG